MASPLAAETGDQAPADVDAWVGADPWPEHEGNPDTAADGPPGGPADGLPDRIDVLVAGSGAAGLVAALVAAAAGLRVLVCERAARIGGTTALSGGRVWIPGNDFQADPARDRADAARYLAGIFDTRHTAMTAAFLATGPAMTRAVQAHTAHRFAPCPDYPDYHPDRPGATSGGRCLDARPLALRGLTSLTGRVRVPPGYLPVTHAEWERWRLPQRYDRELLARRRAVGEVTGGVALVAALLDGVVRAGAAVLTGHRVGTIDPLPDGGLAVAVGRPDGTVARVVAGSVVLATGGFDQDPVLRGAYLPAAVAASGSGPANTGDALRAVSRLDTWLDNLDQGWWMPMIAVPGDRVDGVPAYRAVIRERGSPRLIIVDRSGRRFANEALPYHELVRAMLGTGGGPRHDEAFLIVDAGFRRRYPLPGLPPGEPDPRWLAAAGSLEDLAVRLGIDPDGLREQVRRWNDCCARGVDDEFGKGGSGYDRYHGDPEQAGNPNLGPLDTPPFYGLRLLPGTIGSKGGPVTDTDARVLGAGGLPIPGLFAVGNAAAFWTGGGYPGPGATLGAGMTFGYRAGLAIAAARGAAARGAGR